MNYENLQETLVIKVRGVYLVEKGIRLSIVFLNFNRITETRCTVETLLRLVGERSDIEIIAVDNGSTDGTGEYLRQQKAIISILLGKNMGIAGYNDGFRRASGEIILVLDDDSCPRDNTIFDRLLDIFMAGSDIGIVACHIENPDGTAQRSWHLPVQSVPGPSPFFVGCGFGIRRQLFSQIGWYPEHFFLYQNEIDVSFQVRKNHYKIVYHPECHIIHRGQPNKRSGRRRIYYPTRNTLWLIKKYYPQPMAGYMQCSRLVIGLLRAVIFGELTAYGLAVRDSFRKPVEKDTASIRTRSVSAPFWRQNSLFHHLFRIT